MPEPFEIARNRGLQTDSTWNTYNSAFKVGKLTLALHTADVNLLSPQALARDVAKDVFDMAEEARNTNLEVLADLNVRVPHVIESNLEADSGLQNQFAEIYSIQSEGQDGLQQRASKVISLWNLYNTERAAQVPPLTALDVGGKVVADLTTALTNHPVLIKTANDKKALWTKAKSTLRLTTEKVDANNKRWFEAWGNYYPAGTPEHDALNDIDTEGGGAQPVAKGVIDMINDLGSLTIDVHFHADHSTSATLEIRQVGESSWTQLATEAPGDTWSGTVPHAGAWEVAMTGNNSDGTGERSDPFPITVA